MLLGPRQVGKTTLCETMLSRNTLETDIIRWTGDSITDRVLLSVNDLANLRTYTLINQSNYLQFVLGKI